jgi:hypothetical protein
MQTGAVLVGTVETMLIVVMMAASGIILGRYRFWELQHNSPDLFWGIPGINLWSTVSTTTSTQVPPTTTLPSLCVVPCVSGWCTRV